MKRWLLTAAIVSWVTAAGSVVLAQPTLAPEPKMRMHRVQAGSPDATGWFVAASTEGGYSVILPCKFNDYTVDANRPTGEDTHLYMVGCQRHDNVRFSTMRVTFTDKEVGAQQYYDQFANGKMLPGALIKKGQYDGMSVATAIVRGQPCAWSRMVRLRAEVLMMIVEPIKVACQDHGEEAAKFFGTLEVHRK